MFCFNSQFRIVLCFKIIWSLFINTINVDNPEKLAI